MKRGILNSVRRLIGVKRKSGGIKAKMAHRGDGAESALKRGQSGQLKELRRVILHRGTPRPNSLLQNEEPLFREIQTCRALAPDAIFIFGFARSGTSITLELINYSCIHAFLTGEANFYIPKHIADFREWYGGHVKIQGNQVNKSFYAPNLIPGRERTWWEYLLALSEFYPIVGDKMALSATHFELCPRRDIHAFFEARFLASRYVFLLRDPVQTLLSWARLSGIADDGAMKREIAAWLTYVQLWADFVRILPKTCTLMHEDLGPKSIPRLEAFLEIPLFDNFFQPEARRSWETYGGFQSLEKFSNELRGIYRMAQIVSATCYPMWQADRIDVLKTDGCISSSKLDSMTGYTLGPISEVWSASESLLNLVSQK